MNLDPQTIITRSDAILSTTLGDEVAMMSIDEGVYYGLNPVGARIWHLIEEPLSVAQICDQLIAEYDVDPDTCRRDVAAFIDALRTKEVVHLS